MKREIKFRVWDNVLKVMYTPEMEEKEKNLWRISANGGDFTHSYDGGFLMQYTGLKDKNGKEIYEGDILHVNGEKIRVHFADGCFFLFNSPLWSFNHLSEIIGNIYENPELL